MTQGTGCATLAGILSAARSAGTNFTDMRFVCAGAGSAGLGVCNGILQALLEMGMSEEEARSRFVLCTHLGAIGANDSIHGDPHYPELENDSDRWPWRNTKFSDGTDMLQVVKEFKPDCLLGLAGQPTGIFNENIVRTMAQNTDRPIIMPMSNPTSCAECTPAQAYEWTEGRAVVATGSPFEPVNYAGNKLIPSHNNMYVFPGIGLAASVAGVQTITDRMFYRAALAVVDAVEEEEFAEGRTFPVIERIRSVSVCATFASVA